MKKGILTSLICFTSMVLFSCGSKTVKVKLIGDQYLKWEKTEDIASITQDYIVKACPEKGYVLFPENLYIISGGRPLSDVGEFKQYTLDEEKQEVTIYKNYIYGDIEITGSGQEKDYSVTYEYDSESYETISKDYVTITAPKISKIIKAKTGKTIIISGLSVIPSDVKYTYIKKNDEEALLEIENTEFYRDITIAFPNL